MVEDQGGGQRLYKARGADGEVAWVDHQELWRLQQAQAEETRRQHARRRRRLLLALVAVLVVAIALVFLWLRPVSDPGLVTSAAQAPTEDGPAMEPESSPADGAAETPTGPPLVAGSETATGSPVEAAGSEGMAATGEVAAGAAEPAAAAQPEAEAAEPAATELEAADGAATQPGQRVAEAVRAWTAAWARQDMAAYLAAYSPAFTPAGGLSRSSWQDLRRRRLLAPASIAVEIEELEVIELQPGRAEARFLQRYRSPIYADVVRKTLDLVEEEGAWRILAERVESP